MRLFIAGLLTIVLIPAVASAKVSTAKVVDTPSGLISCYATIPVEGSGIVCSATYLTAPGNDGDPEITLKRHGASALGRRGDYGGYNVRPAKLGYGDTWKRPGIRCSLATSGLTCRNLDGHGFHLAKGDVRRF